VRIWEKAADFDPAKGTPLAWMAVIARNRALDELRRVRPASLEEMPETFEPAGARPSLGCQAQPRGEGSQSPSQPRPAIRRGAPFPRRHQATVAAAS
jgi:DNA-directed RNA polymerase specialized sigma24 family protein